MLFETHSAIAPFTIMGHDSWRQWYIGGMGGKSFIFTYDSVYSEFSWISFPISVHSGFLFANLVVISVYGLWLSRQLAPCGVLLNYKAPRNNQGDIEFDW
jgi:hypothetical protein